MVSLQVSNSLDDLSDGGLLFEFVDFRITSLEPSFGPIDGSTLVSIRSHLFSPSATEGHFCVFGTLDPVGATFVDTGLIVCVTPQSARGALSVHLRLDAAIVEVPFVFSFEEPLPVVDLHPTSGPELGGTTVVVRGSGFSDHPRIYCRFNRMQVPSRIISTSLFSCATPASEVVSGIQFQVVRGEEGALVWNGTFLYELGAQVAALSPSRGPAEGGTRVAVNGAHFSSRASQLGYLRCRFNNTDVPAEYLAPTTI
eukprot:1325765-Prymnesium_polylepis.1